MTTPNARQISIDGGSGTVIRINIDGSSGNVIRISNFLRKFLLFVLIRRVRGKVKSWRCLGDTDLKARFIQITVLWIQNVLVSGQGEH